LYLATRVFSLKRILFITATRVGDAVLSTGLLEALRAQHPDARFTVACGPAAVPVFQGLPELERTIVLRKAYGAGHWRMLWRKAVTTRWHTVVDLRRSALAWLVPTQHRCIPPKGGPPEHKLATFARAIAADRPLQPTLWLTQADHDRAARLVDPDRPIFALAPTANWAAKVWPPDRFAELTRRVAGPGAPLANAQVFVTGGPGEEAQAQPVLDSVPKDRRIAAVGLDLPTTAAVFSRCQLFVGNDSGLMHLASAAGAPTVGLFGPSDERLYAPRGPSSRVVRTPESFAELVGAPDFDNRTSGSLMGNLTVSRVETVARSLLASANAVAADAPSVAR
jgi:ADP-heptose:LPS heptosyltransferase